VVLNYHINDVLDGISVGGLAGEKGNDEKRKERSNQYLASRPGPRSPSRCRKNGFSRGGEKKGRHEEGKPPRPVVPRMASELSCVRLEKGSGGENNRHSHLFRNLSLAKRGKGNPRKGGGGDYGGRINAS